MLMSESKEKFQLFLNKIYNFLNFMKILNILKSIWSKINLYWRWFFIGFFISLLVFYFFPFQFEDNFEWILHNPISKSEE